MSSWARQSSARSIVPSARMSHSMPASSVKPSSRCVDLADRARVRERARFVEPVRHRQRLAVIGDRQVVQAGGLCGARHRSRCRRGRRSPSCGCAGRPAGRRAAPAAGSAPALGGLDLAAVLAQFRRHEREPERRVDPLLVLAGDSRVVVHAVQAVLVQLQPALDRAVAQDDVVGLRAGEVLQRRAEALARHERAGPPGSRPTAARSTWCRRARAPARRSV